MKKLTSQIKLIVLKTEHLLQTIYHLDGIYPSADKLPLKKLTYLQLCLIWLKITYICLI